MKNIITTILTVILFSCQHSSEENSVTDSANVNNPNTLNGHIIFASSLDIQDTIYIYYKNGKIKEKGCILNKNRIGWWFAYNDTGQIVSKSEYIIKNNSSFQNQHIFYKDNRGIDFSRSSFFNIKMKDTLPKGKSIGKLKYYSNATGYQTRYIYIIINNQYSERVFKKDTFTADIDKLWFGVNAFKDGDFKVSGIIEEEISYVSKEKDSTQLTIKKIYKYFEKDLIVK